MLDHLIYYVLHRSYPRELTKEKNRAVRRRATNLVVEKGEVFSREERTKGMYFLILFKRYIKSVSGYFTKCTSFRFVGRVKQEQQRILTVCQSKPTFTVNQRQGILESARP